MMQGSLRKIIKGGKSGMFPTGGGGAMYKAHLMLGESEGMLPKEILKFRPRLLQVQFQVNLHYL